MRKKIEDTLFAVILFGLALTGIGVIVHTTVALALGIGSPDQPIRFFTGAGLIAIALCLGVSFALAGGIPPWGPLRRLAARVRFRHAKWQREQHEAMQRHLDGLPSDECQRVLAEIPEDSFLHPRNLPYGRTKPGCFD